MRTGNNGAKRAALALIIGGWALLLTGCNGNPELDRAALELVATADACLYEVRDGGALYERAGNCKALGQDSLTGSRSGGAAMRYIDAGGLKPGESLQNQLRYAQARTSAWMALAISNARQAGDRSPQRIW